MPVSFAEMVARPTTPAAEEGGATTGQVSFAEMRGQMPSAPEPSILGFLSDTQSWKDMLGTPAAVGNLLLSGPGTLMSAGAGALKSAVSMIPNPLGSTPELRSGLPRREALQRGAEASGAIGEALSPTGLAKTLGYEPDQTAIDTAMNLVSQGIRKYGTTLESKYRYPDGTPVVMTEDVEAIANLLMGKMGTKPYAAAGSKLVKGKLPAGAVPEQPSVFPTSGLLRTLAMTPEEIRNGKLSPPDTPQAGGGQSVRAARATYGEPPKGDEASTEPPTYGELPYRSATPIPKTVEERAAALKESEKNMKAAVRAETPAQRTARMTINALPQGEAIWTSGTTDYPVTITGEPVRGPDGKMYTPVKHGDTASFVPAEELKRGTVPPEVPQPLRVDYAEANDIAQIPGSQRTPEQMIRLRQHLRNLGGNRLSKASAEQLAWVGAGVGGALYLSQQDFDKLSPESAALIVGLGGAIKGPGGFFPASTVDKLARPFLKDIDIRETMNEIPGIRDLTQAEQTAKAKEVYDKEATAPRRMVKNWLTRYAGTAADPLKDITVPVDVIDKATYRAIGTKPVRWEDLIDQILAKTSPYGFGEDVPGKFIVYPNLKELPENEASWTIGNPHHGGKAFDPRTGDPYWRPGVEKTDYTTLPPERMLDYSDLYKYQAAFENFMSHVGDYYGTLDPVKRNSYDLPRLVKETIADDAKKAKEAAAYKETSKKARLESVAGDDVVATYPEVELPERVLHRNNPSGTSAKNMVDETLPPATTKFSWVQLKKPGQFFDEGRFMGHSVGGYDLVEGQPGWTPASGTAKQNTYASDYYGHGGNEAIKSGKAEIYSLRDSEGNSYATFEVKKAENGERTITQMKGPGNKDVAVEAQQYAQDFATDPKWDAVKDVDLGKIGLSKEEFDRLSYERSKARFDKKIAEERAKRAGGDLIDPAALASIAAAVGIGAYALNGDDKEGTAMLGMGAIVAGRGRGPFKGIPEAKLIDYVRAGSEGAASELYARGKTQIEKTARRFGPEADDIAQRSWEKAFRAVKSGAFQGDAQFMTYLTRIVMNEGINKGKFEGRRPTVSMEEGKTAGPEGETRGGIEDTLGHEETPEKAQLSKELGERVSAAMDRVDPNMRESFLLREVEGLDYAEIAARRGIPTGTVRSQISRVKESLQQMLRQDADIAKRQQGYSTPGLTIGLGAITAGAAIGALVNPEHPVSSALYGAGIGALLMNAHPKAWAEAIQRARETGPLVRIDDLIRATVYGKKVQERATYQLTSKIYSRVPDPVRRQAIYDWLEGERPVQLSVIEEQVARDVRSFYDELGRAAKDAGVVKNLLDNYATRIYGRKARGLLEGKIVGGNVVTSSPFGKPRAFPTRAMAEAAGFIPVTTDIARVVEMYSSSISEAMNNKQFIETLKASSKGTGTQLIAKADKAPADYVFISHPQLRGYMVHPDIAGDVRFVFDTTDTGAIVGTLDAINSTQKRMGVSFSLFHAKALEDAMIGATSFLKSPARGIRIFGQAFAPVLFGENLAVKMIREGGAGDLVDYAQKSGLEISFEQKGPAITEEASGGMYRGLEATSKFLDNAVPKLGTLTAGNVVKLNHLFDRAMWGRFHAALKLETFADKSSELSRNNAREVAAGKSQLKSKDEIGRMAASFTNDIYGGLNWYGIVNEFSSRWGREVASAAMSPAGRLGMRLMLFAPDWTISTTRAFVKAFGAQGVMTGAGAVLGSEMNTDSTQNKLLGGLLGAVTGYGAGRAAGLKGMGGLRLKELMRPTETADLHRQYILRSAFIYSTVIDAINYQMSGHHFWDNKDPTRLDRGDGTTQQVSKHFMEPFHWLLDPKKQLMGKASFLVKETASQLGDSEYWSPKGAPRMGQTPKEQDVSLTTRLAHAGKQFTPISAQGFEADNPTKAAWSIGGMPVYGKTYAEKADAAAKLKALHASPEYKALAAKRKLEKVQAK